jgi:hypothetical protein
MLLLQKDGKLVYFLFFIRYILFRLFNLFYFKDPFGASSVTPTLNKLSGFDAHVIDRVTQKV